MAMVLAVILVLAVAFSLLGTFAIRSEQIARRLDGVTRQARDIAYLAARNDTSTAAILFGLDDTTARYLSWKSEEVYEEYGAYIVVVDRRGRVMDNLSLARIDDPDFVASLNGRELSDALVQVLGGEEISVRTEVGGETTFTVGVPFMRNGTVLGAVLIHTKAQSIEGPLYSLILPVLLVVTLTLGAAGIGIFFYVRSTMKPLKALEGAARDLSEGNFATRLSLEGLSSETREVAGAFNQMAERIQANDESRREFVANVSHELRSPITSISGFVQGMLDGTIPPEDHEQYLRVVGDETGRLTKLISDLLALSRLERDDAELSRSSFDMCEMIRKCVIRFMTKLEEKQMDLDCDFRLDPCMVFADPDRIEQVLVNLLDNAIKFTPEGGRITLVTEERDGKAAVTVQDSGCGVPEEDRDRIFERFFTSDRAHTSGKGTGLGLSICERIMKMHGETIRLLDTEEGAAFRFTVPLDSHGK